jgi:three-Cys-motif partner protein
MSRDDHFVEFKAHTLLKHGVLDRYVKAWIQIMKPRHAKLWIVDGFAGRGEDLAGNPGSPLLLARSAAALSTPDCAVRLVAIEPDTEWFNDLANFLRPFNAEADGSVPVAYLRKGKLAERAEEAFELVGQGPAFVFLDPFGADGLDLEVVRRTLGLQKSEVFALFSHQGVCRHLSVLAALPHADRAQRAARSKSASLFPEMDAEDLERELKEAARSDAGLMPTKEAAKRILTSLFGEWARVEELLGLPSESWAREVVSAYMRVLSECGATHITPIAIVDDTQRLTYFLVHAAKQAKAPLKMKEAVNAAVEKSRLLAAYKDQFRLAVSVSVESVVEAVRARFAGRAVRWAEEGGVREFALSETLMFNSQADALKRALEPYVETKRPLTYSFPSIN